MSQRSVEAIYFEALEKGTPEERTTYLDQVCGQDKALRRKVDRMLSMHANVGEFLEKPAISHLSATQLKFVVTDVVAPETVGRYQILKEIGRGGMGVVYQAWDSSLKRHVAIKMVLSGRFGSKQEQQRFRKESEVVARLQHPNIVQIHEVGQHQDLPYLVLEWIDGGSLAQYMKKQKIQPREAAALVQQIARGLQFAHSLGIIHRDLKPGNILLSSSISSTSSHISVTDEPASNVPAPASHKSLAIAHYTAKLTDFGLAKLVEEDDDLTQTGQVMGTPSYLSPEQAKGSKLVGPANDVYSLGAILYELLSGDPPHVAKSPMETVLKVIHEEVKPLSQSRHGVPLDLATICQKCLMRDPSKRFASAGEFADDLNRFLQGEPIRARPVGQVERLWLWAQRKPALAASLAFAVTSMVLGTILTLIYAISATHHASEATRSANEADAARKVANLEEKKARAQSAALLLQQAQSIAEGGKVDHALFMMIKAWENADPEDQLFLQTLPRNIHAWLSYAPQLLWQIETQAERFLCFSHEGRQCVFWANGHFIHRDAVDGKEVKREKADHHHYPIVYQHGSDLRRVALLDRREDAAQRFVQIMDVNTWQPLTPRFDFFRGSFKGDYNRLQFTDQDDIVLQRSSSLEEGKYVMRIRPFSISSANVLGTEFVASINALMEPVITPDGKLAIVIAEPDEKGVVKELLTGKVLDLSLEALKWNLKVSPASGSIHAVTSNTRNSGMNYFDRDVFRLWESPRMKQGIMNLTHDGLTGFLQESTQSLRPFDLHDRIPLLGSITCAEPPPPYGFINNISVVNPYAPILCVMGETHTRIYRYSPVSASMERNEQSQPKLIHASSGVSVSPTQSMIAIFQNEGQRGRGNLMRMPQRHFHGTTFFDATLSPVWSRDGRYLAVASPHEKLPRVKVIDTTTGKLRYSLPMSQYVHSLEFNHRGDSLAIGIVAGVLLYDMSDGKRIAKLEQPGPIVQMQFSDDDTRLVACSRSGWTGTQPGFRIWNLQEMAAVSDLIPSPKAPHCFFSKQQDVVAIDLTKGTVSQYSINGDHLSIVQLEKYVMQGVASEEPVRTVRINSSQTTLAIGSNDGTVGLWNLATGRMLTDYLEHADTVRFLAFSPDDRWLAIGIGDRRVRLRDAQTGMIIGPLFSSPNQILSVGFGLNSQTLQMVDASGETTSCQLYAAQQEGLEWYRSLIQQHTGLVSHDSVFRWLGLAEWQKHRRRVTSVNPEYPGGAPWHQQQAIDCWKRRLNHAALWHASQWERLEPQSPSPLLFQIEIHLVMKNQQQADLCRSELLKRGYEIEVSKLYEMLMAK